MKSHNHPTKAPLSWYDGDDVTITRYKAEQDGELLYINAKVPDEGVETIFETTHGHPDAVRVLTELKKEFTGVILWISKTPTSSWKREHKGE